MQLDYFRIYLFIYLFIEKRKTDKTMLSVIPEHGPKP